MGNYQSSPNFDDLPRKAGQDWNMRSDDKRYLIEHKEVWTPEQQGNSRKFLVCRCFKSEKFPLCDFSHGVMQMQGAHIGPCMFEVRKTPGLEPNWWEAGLKGWWSNPVEWGHTTKSLLGSNLRMAEPIEYMHRVDVNTNKYNEYHHMIETFPSIGEKIVKVCRCWQSKRFPVCDDTHKQLIEAGDPVGPYVAVIRKTPQQQGSLKNVSSVLNRASQNSRVTRGVLMCAAVGVAAVGSLLGKNDDLHM